MTQIEIRAPQWKDLPQLLELGRRMHQEVWYAHIPLSESQVATFFYNVMINTDRNFCRLAVADGVIIGAIAGARMPYWFSTASGVFDQFLFVDRNYRGTLAAFRLWREMLAWSRYVGAVELTHGVGTSSPVADRFFHGLGMNHVGGIYKLALTTESFRPFEMKHRGHAQQRG
jgi:hypothetical protein